MSKELVNRVSRKDDAERRRITEGLRQIDVALNEGKVVGGFKRGNLRVVYIDDPKKNERRGFGECPAVELAFVEAGQSFKKGLGSSRRPYSTDGVLFPASPLDAWLLEGKKFGSYKNPETNQIVFELFKTELLEDENGRIVLNAKGVGVRKTVKRGLGGNISEAMKDAFNAPVIDLEETHPKYFYL